MLVKIVPSVLSELVYTYECQADDPGFLDDNPTTQCVRLAELFGALDSKKTHLVELDDDACFDILQDTWAWSDMDWFEGAVASQTRKMRSAILENESVAERFRNWKKEMEE